MATQIFRFSGDGSLFLLDVWRLVMRFSIKIGLNRRDIEDLLGTLQRRLQMEPADPIMIRLEAILQARLKELKEEQ